MLNFDEPHSLYPTVTSTFLGPVPRDPIISPRISRYGNNLSRYGQDPLRMNDCHRDYGLLHIAPRGPGI